MQHVTFECLVRFVSNAGDIYVLADADDLMAVEGSIARGEEFAAGVSGGRPRKGKAEPKEPKIDPAQVAAVQMQLAADRAFLEQQRRLVVAYGQAAETMTAVMHRWTYREYYSALEEARRYASDLSAPTVDQAAFRTAILAKCIESWSVDDPITRDAIENLPRQIVETLFARLQRRSEPTSDRLDFLRALGVRPGERPA